MRIAVIGDDDRLKAQLGQLLAGQGYAVEPNAWSPLLAPKLAAFDLVVLVQPPAAGLAPLLGALRQDGGSGVPVLCVSPRSGVADGVACLDAGADDFINRPFNPSIFLARVRTLLRRRVWAGQAAESSDATVQSGPLVMRLISRQTEIAGAPVALTRLEFDLLAFLVKNADKVFRREELLEAVWNYPDNVATRTLDKHVETLRRKLGGCGASLQTVHGVGYRFVPPATVTKGARHLL